MSKIYILAFESSGAKVLESLVMQMAACSSSNFHDNDIIPLLVTLDPYNGNVEKCRQLIERYAEINKSIYPVNPDSLDYINSRLINNFFGTRLKTLADICPEKNTDLYTSLITGCRDFHNFISPVRLRDDIHSLCRPDFSNDRANVNTLLESLFGSTPIYPDYPGSAISPDRLSLENRGIIRLMYAISGIMDNIQFKTFWNCISPVDKLVVVGSSYNGLDSAGILNFMRELQCDRHDARHYGLIGVEIAFVLLDPPSNADEIAPNMSDSFYNIYDSFEDVKKTTYRIKSDAIDTTPIGYQQSPAAKCHLTGAIAISDFAARYAADPESMICDVKEGARSDFKNLLEATPNFKNIESVSEDFGYFSLLAYCIARHDLLHSLIVDAEHAPFQLDTQEIELMHKHISDFMSNYIQWWKAIAGESNLFIFDFDAENLKNLIPGKAMQGKSIFDIWGLQYNSIYRGVKSSLMKKLHDIIHHQNVPLDQISLYAEIFSAFRHTMLKEVKIPFREV